MLPRDGHVLISSLISSFPRCVPVTERACHPRQVKRKWDTTIPRSVRQRLTRYGLSLEGDVGDD